MIQLPIACFLATNFDQQLFVHKKGCDVRGQSADGNRLQIRGHSLQLDHAANFVYGNIGLVANVYICLGCTHI